MGLLANLFKGNHDTQSNVQPNVGATAVPTQVQLTNNILNLNKGDILNLSKAVESLTKVRAAAGWDVNPNPSGANFDLDLCAYLMTRKTASACIYYGNKRGPGLYLDGDNLTGRGSGDDENIFVNLNAIPANVDRIIFAVVIYSARSRGQSFANVNNAYMRLVDETTGREICRYNLTKCGGNHNAAILASIDRVNGEWVFKAIGDYTDGSIGQLF